MDEIKQLIRLTLAQILSSNGFQGSMKNSLTILTDFTFYLFMRIAKKYKKILTATENFKDKKICTAIRIALLKDIFAEDSFEMVEYYGYLYFMKKMDFNSKFVNSFNIFPKSKKVLQNYYGLKNIEIYNDVNFDEEKIIKTKGEGEDLPVDEEILKFIMECEQYKIKYDKKENIEGNNFTVRRSDNEEIISKEYINRCIDLYDDVIHEKYENVLNAVDFATMVKIRKYK